MNTDLLDIEDALADATLRADAYDLFRAYDSGQHRANYASPAFKEKYSWLVQAGVVNLCPRIIASFADLVAIDHWEGADADQAADMAEAVDLPKALQLAVREALTSGDAYLNVWPNPNGTERVWFHRADQAGYLPDPVDPMTPRLYYQRWDEEATDGHLVQITPRLNLYYPDGWVTRWVGPVSTGGFGDRELPISGYDWSPFDADGQPEAYRSDAGQLTWVHLAFDPAEQGGFGRSLLRDAIPLQDGMNHAYASLLVSTERVARPLRGVLNYQPEQRLNPATGLMETQPLRVDETQDSFIGLNGNGPVFEWAQADPTGLIKIMETYGAWMARVVGMPITDLIPDLGNVPSGAALRLLAAARTATVRTFTASITDEIATVMRLLGLDAQPVWRDPAPVDDGELIDRATAKEALGIPLSRILAELGYSPDTVAEIVAERDAEEARAASQAVRAYDTGGTL